SLPVSYGRPHLGVILGHHRSSSSISKRPVTFRTSRFTIEAKITSELSLFLLPKGFAALLLCSCSMGLTRGRKSDRSQIDNIVQLLTEGRVRRTDHRLSARGVMRFKREFRGVSTGRDTAQIDFIRLFVSHGVLMMELVGPPRLQALFNHS